MSYTKVILIGPCGGGCTPKNGASAKNYHLAYYIQSLGINLKIIDTEKWRKNPSILISLFITICFNPKAKFILATDNMSGYRTLQVLNMFPRKRSIIYWIIGGSIADWIKEGKVKRKPYEIVEWFLAEGKKMQNTFAECGFKNTIYVPNFKNIGYIPSKSDKANTLLKLVFLSRIIPEKGCNIIIEAIRTLASQYKERVCVDFYGPIENSYEAEFYQRINSEPNISYKGFLDLRNHQNYDILANYDVMLFPTYWHGEGFPGIMIDAFVSGLPIIASDWNLNADIIEDGKTGIILKNNNVETLREAIVYCVDNKSFVKSLSKECQGRAHDYNIRNVLSKELFTKIGITL